MFTEEELKKWWIGQCPSCHWRGLSRDAAGGHPIADTGDCTDVVCPVCRTLLEPDERVSTAVQLGVQALFTADGDTVLLERVQNLVDQVTAPLYAKMVEQARQIEKLDVGSPKPPGQEFVFVESDFAEAEDRMRSLIYQRTETGRYAAGGEHPVAKLIAQALQEKYATIGNEVESGIGVHMEHAQDDDLVKLIGEVLRPPKPNGARTTPATSNEIE